MATPRQTHRPAGALARRFQQRRLQLGITQEELADLAGVSRSTVQALEAGRTSVRMNAAQSVAEALGLTLAVLARAEADR